MNDSMNNYAAFQLLLYDLTGASCSKSDFNIVLALIECLSRDGSIPKIKDLADQAATSTSSISRFAKTLGYQDYQSFRYKFSNIKETMVFRRRALYTDDPDATKEKILNNLNATWDQMDFDKLNEIIKALLTAKNTMFAGNNDNLICFFDVYKDLFFKPGANYFFYDLKTQEDFLTRLGKDDCLLAACTSTDTSMFTKERLKMLKKKGVTIILFAQEAPEEITSLCDIVYMYGREHDLFIGNYSLQYLGYVLSYLIKKQYPD